MIAKTFATALTVAVLGASAFAATTTASQAGYYGGYHYKPHYVYSHCYYKKIRVWGHYGYHWKRIKVCH